TDRQTHLPCHGGTDGGCKLSSVADDRDNDKSNKGSTDMPRIHDAINRVHQGIRTEGNTKRGKEQHDAGRPEVEPNFLVCVAVRVGITAVEYLGVALKLEVKIYEVKNQENNRSNTRKVENTAV
ncbi:hypothetical protein F66182_17503, partial [Fusarium sp. NRRL 66182]